MTIPCYAWAMKPDVPPTISSFVIRFVVEDTSDEDGTRSAYRGAIRHVQSAEVLNFNDWQEAQEFIRRFVPIEDSK